MALVEIERVRQLLVAEFALDEDTANVLLANGINNFDALKALKERHISALPLNIGTQAIVESKIFEWQRAQQLEIPSSPSESVAAAASDFLSSASFSVGSPEPEHSQAVPLRTDNKVFRLILDYKLTSLQKKALANSHENPQELTTHETTALLNAWLTRYCRLAKAAGRCVDDFSIPPDEFAEWADHLVQCFSKERREGWYSPKPKPSGARVSDRRPDIPTAGGKFFNRYNSKSRWCSQHMRGEPLRLRRTGESSNSDSASTSSSSGQQRRRIKDRERRQQDKKAAAAVRRSLLYTHLEALDKCLNETAILKQATASCQTLSATFLQCWNDCYEIRKHCLESDLDIEQYFAKFPVLKNTTHATRLFHEDFLQRFKEEGSNCAATLLKTVNIHRQAILYVANKNRAKFKGEELKHLDLLLEQFKKPYPELSYERSAVLLLLLLPYAIGRGLSYRKGVPSYSDAISNFLIRFEYPSQLEGHINRLRKIYEDGEIPPGRCLRPFLVAWGPTLLNIDRFSVVVPYTSKEGRFVLDYPPDVDLLSAVVRFVEVAYALSLNYPNPAKHTWAFIEKDLLLLPVTEGSSTAFNQACADLRWTQREFDLPVKVDQDEDQIDEASTTLANSGYSSQEPSSQPGLINLSHLESYGSQGHVNSLTPPPYQSSKSPISETRTTGSCSEEEDKEEEKDGEELASGPGESGKRDLFKRRGVKLISPRASQSKRAKK